MIGRLPNFLLTNVKTVWIHKGKKSYGGGNENLLIHTGRSKEYISKEILEEVFIHEAGHTSLDWDFGGLLSKAEWQKAKSKDKEHISDYANNELVLNTIPNRLKFFDEQNFNMYPLVPRD